MTPGDVAGQLAVEGLKAVFGLVTELLGEGVARETCDEVCRIRQHRAGVVASRDAKDAAADAATAVPSRPPTEL